jgi:hypothetical protein
VEIISKWSEQRSAVRSIAWLDVTDGNASGVMLEELSGDFATN